MRTDWFADVAPSPAVPGPSPVTGDAANRSVMPVSPPVPGTERKTGHDRRAIVTFALPDASDAWPVVIGAPGESVEDVMAALRRRYGDRLLDVRPYRPEKHRN